LTRQKYVLINIFTFYEENTPIIDQLLILFLFVLAL
jgi:hypothetical protein